LFVTMVASANMMSVVPSCNSDEEKKKEKSDDTRSKSPRWSTNERGDIEVAGGNIIIRRFDLFDCIFYCIFMFVFLVMITLMRSHGSNNFFAGYSIEQALEGDRTTKYFAEVRNIEDFWEYTIQEFLPNLLVEEFDNGEEISDPYKRYYVAETNLLMGGFRIGQKRVAPEKCEVPDVFKESFTLCYPAYSTKKSAKDPIVIDADSNFTVHWQNHHQTQDSIWTGLVSTYDGHGYVVDFRRNLNESLSRVNQLRAARFVDEQTRAIFFDFNTFNPTYNIDTVARLVFEFPPSGGIWPYFEIKSWQLRYYFGSRGTCLMVFETFFWIGVVYYLVEEICEILSPWDF